MTAPRDAATPDTGARPDVAGYDALAAYVDPVRVPAVEMRALLAYLRAVEGERDRALQLLNLPDSTNDGGPANLVDAIQSLLSIQRQFVETEIQLRAQIAHERDERLAQLAARSAPDPIPLRCSCGATAVYNKDRYLICPSCHFFIRSH